MTRITGVVTAIVTDVADPEAQGRIKLRFPWLAEEGADSSWAPIAAPMGGRDRGYYYMPEVDDEALVAFERGDVNYPFVLGFLHNGVDVPPFQGIDEHVRRVRTVAGHVLEFDDRQGKESVRLKTNSGHHLEMRDPEGLFDIVTAAGQKVRLQDMSGKIMLSTVGGNTITIEDSPSQITLQTATGVSLTASDAGGVSVSAPVGSVQLTATTIVVESAASVSITAPSVAVNAPMASFSGVVQCNTLIASTGVVSPAYTPGAGNIS